MSDLEKAVRAVEEGLLTANTIKGVPQEELSLGERMATYHVPGMSIALIEEDEIAWTGEYGVLEAGGDKRVTEETIFQAASISKPVTAMTALSLVEAGALDLDRDVNEMLTSWKVPENEHTKENKVTLRGLLSHTAGISVFGYRGYPAGEPLPNLQQILNGEPPANSEAVGVMQAPGKGFSYSGGGYVLIEQVMEDVTGRPLAELAQELVFDKVGMTNSTFEHFIPETCIPQTATAHLVNGDPVPGKWHAYPEHAPASLWSTPSDLGRLIIEVLKSYKGESGKVLSTEMTRQMLTPEVGWMGLGFVVVEREGWTRFDHPGWNEGFHSYFSGYLGAGQGLVWMTNGENGKLLGYEVMRGLAKLFGWPEFVQVEKTVFQVDSGVLAQYEGTYREAAYPDFSVEVIKEGDALFIQEPWGGLRFQIFPESETDFFCLHRQEKFSFIKDDKGKVVTMMMGQFTELERVDEG